jgi:hypothetical protein
MGFMDWEEQLRLLNKTSTCKEQAPSPVSCPVAFVIDTCTTINIQDRSCHDTRLEVIKGTNDQLSLDPKKNGLTSIVRSEGPMTVLADSASSAEVPPGLPD